MMRLLPLVLVLAASACTSDHVRFTAEHDRLTAATCSPTGGDANGPDQCATDSDCSNGGVCSCAGTTFEWSHQTRNLCVPAACHVDADCGSFACSPTLSECGSFYGIQGYYCHAADDQCGGDADCVQSGRQGHCVYTPEVSHWTCSYSFCAG
jgi:hypothetical protein